MAVPSATHVLLPLEAILLDLPMPANKGFLDQVNAQFSLNVAEEGWQQISSEQLEGIKLLYQSTFGGLPNPIPGGSGTNVAKALTHLGTASHIVGPIGDDLCGSQFHQAMKRPRLSMDLNTISGSPTGQVLCIITEGGKRTMLACKGASAHVDPFRLRDEHFSSARHIHLEGYAIAHRPFMERVVEGAKKEGLTVSYDLGSRELVAKHREELWELLNSGTITLLMGNRGEMQELTQLESPEDMCKKLTQLCSVVSLTDDANGCYVASKTLAPTHVPALLLDKQVIDQTGAGDYHSATFLDCFLKRKPLTVCASAGNYVAAHIVAVEGTELDSETWGTILNEIPMICE